LHAYLLPEARRPRVSFNYLGIWQDSYVSSYQDQRKSIYSYAPERVKNTLYDQYENIVGLAVNILYVQGVFSFAFKYNQCIWSQDKIREFSRNFINNIKGVLLNDSCV